MRLSIFFLLISSFVMGQNCPTGEERMEPTLSKFEEEVLRLTNIQRKKKRLEPLKLDKQLSYAARYHAKDMAIENYFDHDSYDRNGKRLKKSCNIFDRIGAFADYSRLAENISAGRTSPEEVVKAWMKSPGHKKNILDKNLRLLGVGYFYSEDSEYGHYWVQNFGAK